MLARRVGKQDKVRESVSEYVEVLIDGLTSPS